MLKARYQVMVLDNYSWFSVGIALHHSAFIKGLGCSVLFLVLLLFVLILTGISETSLLSSTAVSCVLLLHTRARHPTPTPCFCPLPFSLLLLYFCGLEN